MIICPDNWEVKWLTLGRPSLTSDDSTKLSILEHKLDAYQKKAEHPWVKCVTTFLWCSWPYDLSWPWFDLWPFLTSWRVCITIAKIIGSMHIKWKLKTGALQIKYVLACSRSNSAFWPLKTSNFSILKHLHYVHQKKADFQRIPYVRTFFSVLDHMTSHDKDLTSNDIFWPFELKNNY